MPIILTPRGVAKLTPEETIRDHWDAHTTGLGVRVFPSGAKSWTLRYRVGRRQRRMTLGDVAIVSLANARVAARDALQEVAKGHDPAEAKRERRVAETVSEFANVYIAKHAKPKKKSWKADRMRLAIDVLPHWKHRLMKDITRRDVRELLDAIAGPPRNAPIVANRVRSLLHKLFNIAIELDVVETNPVAATARPGAEQQRDRVLTHDEIRALCASFDALDPVMAAYYKLRLLTAQRGGEVASMRWQDLDLENGWWTVPPSAAKNKLAHRVPLSASASAILNDLKTRHEAALTKRAALKRPASKQDVFVLRHARGKRQQAEAAATFTVVDFRGHDLRRTAASLMASAGTSRLVISKILNHVERGVTAVYDRHSYDPEKKIALDAWARQLAAIVEQKPPAADVLPFARAEGR